MSSLFFFFPFMIKMNESRKKILFMIALVSSRPPRSPAVWMKNANCLHSPFILQAEVKIEKKKIWQKTEAKKVHLQSKRDNFYFPCFWSVLHATQTSRCVHTKAIARRFSVQHCNSLLTIFSGIYPQKPVQINPLSLSGFYSFLFGVEDGMWMIYLTKY